MASNDPRGSSNLLEVATDVFAVVSRDVPANPSLRRRVPLTKARHLAADICAVVCGLRPACMIDYAPKMDAGVARAVLETLRADPRSGRHRETRALGVLVVEDVVLIADVDRVMRVFRDVGATGGADRFVAFDPTTSRRMKGPMVKGRYAAWTDARTSSHCAAVARVVPWGPRPSRPGRRGQGPGPRHRRRHRFDPHRCGRSCRRLTVFGAASRAHRPLPRVPSGVHVDRGRRERRGTSPGALVD